MPDRVEAVSIRKAVEEQVAGEAMTVYKAMRDRGIEPEAAARMTNGVMVCVDYVCQYQAEWFLQAPEFTTADKIPVAQETKVIDVSKRDGSPKETITVIVPARKAPRVDPARIDPKDPRPADMPCRGCEEDKRCPEPCEEWHAFQASLNGEAPKAPTPEEAYKAAHKGPAVAAAPAKQPDAPIVVNCYVCGQTCEERESQIPPHKHYWYCPQCKKNRQRDGKPFPSQGKV